MSYNAGFDPSNPIADPRFDSVGLTEAINVAPYRTGRPAQLGIFTDTPIATTFVKLGFTEQELTLIPARPRGGPSNLAERPEERSGVAFNIPHFPVDDFLGPADIQNIAGFTPDQALVTVEQVYAEKLDALRAKHDLTHSYLDWGALNGVILDGSGRQIVDIYDKFEIEQPEVLYDLDTTTTDIAAVNRLAKARLRKELRGTAATGARVLAGATFFDRYTKHQNVRESLQAYGGQTPNPARDEIEDTFTFAGMTLERIDEDYAFRTASGAIIQRKAIPDDEAILIPMGTPFFKRYIAPPDTMAGANRKPTPETKIFVSPEDLPHDKGRHIHTESNVLPICTRPALITRLRIGK